MVTVISGKENIKIFHMLQLKYALKLELIGLKHSRGSVYAYIKRHFNLHGTKQSVYDQFCKLLEEKAGVN